VDVWARKIRQPGNSIFDKSFPPLTNHAQVGFHFSRDLGVAHARCAKQDDARSKRQRLSRCSTASITLEVGPFLSRDF
jgi:hypothetical protein